MVAQALAALIEGWIARSKHNNLNVLHSRTGVSYSTVTRIAQGKVDNPQLDVVIALLPVIATDAERISFLQEFYPSLWKMMERTDSKHTSSREESRNHVFDELFCDPIGFQLAQHLLSRIGISTPRVKELFGEAGLDLIKSLESQQVIEHDGRTWKTNFDYSNSTVEGGKQQAISTAKGFRVESMKVAAGYMVNLSEAVTLEAAQEIVKEIQDCHNRIRVLRDNNPGNHVLLVSLNSYLSDPQSAIDEEASK